MPSVRIEIIKGHNKEYKETMLEAIHEALENSLSISNGDRFQRLYELEFNTKINYILRRWLYSL